MGKYDKIMGIMGSNLNEDCGVTRRMARCRRVEGALLIPIDRLRPDPDQPRKEFDEEDLYRLAGSMKARGQVQALKVRYDVNNDVYVIITGERRLRAAEIAKIDALACVVDDRDSDRLTTQIAENLLRSNLSPIEKANAYKALMEQHGWTAKECAEQLSLSPPSITTMLRLLELSDVDQERIHNGEVSISDALAKVRKEKPKQKPAKPRKTVKRFTVDGSTIVVTVKRAAVSDAEVVGLLQGTIDQLAKPKRRAA